MEFLSSEAKGIALDILEDTLSAIERVEERTKDIHTSSCPFLGAKIRIIM